ncbi:MAG: hypothetical protein AB8B69_13720 [Chitinophagales bacterium]
MKKIFFLSIAIIMLVYCFFFMGWCREKSIDLSKESVFIECNTPSPIVHRVEYRLKGELNCRVGFSEVKDETEDSTPSRFLEKGIIDTVFGHDYYTNSIAFRLTPEACDETSHLEMEVEFNSYRMSRRNRK